MIWRWSWTTQTPATMCLVQDCRCLLQNFYLKCLARIDQALASHEALHFALLQGRQPRYKIHLDILIRYRCLPYADYTMSGHGEAFLCCIATLRNVTEIWTHRPTIATTMTAQSSKLFTMYCLQRQYYVNRKFNSSGRYTVFHCDDERPTRSGRFARWHRDGA